VTIALTIVPAHGVAIAIAVARQKDGRTRR
jgi:hypothetical protein